MKTNSKPENWRQITNPEVIWSFVEKADDKIDELKIINININRDIQSIGETNAELRAELEDVRGENTKLKELAHELDGYTIHNRSMNGCLNLRDLNKCDCGLNNVRIELQALSKVGGNG